MPAIMWPQRMSRLAQSSDRSGARRQIPGKAQRHEDDRQGPGDLAPSGSPTSWRTRKCRSAAPPTTTRPTQQPGIGRIRQHGEVVADHHQQDGQGEIGIVQRALLADGAEARVGRLAADQRRGDLALVGNDDHEDIGGHDGADEHADMDEGAASGKDMGEDDRQIRGSARRRRPRAAAVLRPRGERHSAS